MRMQQVITKARATSPLMALALEEFDKQLARLSGVIGDFSNVKSESARNVLMEQCLAELGTLGVCASVVSTTWGHFDETLGKYSRKFCKSKRKDAPRDAPGQIVMDPIVNPKPDEFIVQCEAAEADRVAEEKAKAAKKDDPGDGIFIADDEDQSSAE